MAVNKFANYTGINIGSGSVGYRGWVNVDSDILFTINGNRIMRLIFTPLLKVAGKVIPVSERVAPPNFVRARLDKGKLPFPSESFKYCYTSHFLEHLERWQAISLLKEINRVLRGEGVVRIVIPDLEILAKAYISYLNGNVQDYFDLKMDAINPVEALNTCFGNTDNDNNGFKRLPRAFRNMARNYVKKRGHKYMYDFSTLRDILQLSGFVNARKLSYREGTILDIDHLDLEFRRFESLYVEAEKQSMETV